MAIRTIQSPGIELVERDLSQYTEAMTGTAVLVTGFASKGRDYEPMNLTTRSSWLQQFGEPTNEAERYFFNACMEVINQGGILYACKLPYKNNALNKFVGKTYTVNVKDEHELSTVAEYIADHVGMKDVIAGDYTSFYERKEAGDDDKYALWHVNDVKDELYKFIDTVSQRAVLIPYAYALSNWMGPIDIEGETRDNWMWTPVQYIYEKTSAMFDQGSYLNQRNGAIEQAANSPDLSDFFYVDSPSTGEKVKIDTTFELSSIPKRGTVDECISSFFDSIQEALGGDPTNPSFKAACDPSSGIGISAIVESFPEFVNSAAYKFFKDNELLFNALNQIDFQVDKELFKGQKPYMYCDEGHFNLGAYWRGICEYNKVKEAISAYNDTDVVKIVNDILDLRDALSSLGADRLSTLFDKPMNTLESKISPALTSDNRYSDEQNEALKNALTDVGQYTLVSPLELIQDAFQRLLADPEFQRIVEESKQGKYKNTPFAKFAIQYYLGNTQIPNVEVQEALRASDTLNVFYEKFDPDGAGDAPSATVFELFNYPESNSPELSSIQAVIDGAIDAMFYNDFLQDAIAFQNPPYLSDFTELSNYAEGTASGSSQRRIISGLLSGSIIDGLRFSEIKRVDPTMKKYLTIDSQTEVQMIDLDTIDGYATGELPVTPNRIVVVDKTRGTLGQAYAKTESGIQKEIVGIIPIVTTAVNALYAQDILETGDSGIMKYNAVKNAFTLRDEYEVKDEDAAVPFASDNANVYTVSQMVAGSFPSIAFDADGHLDRQHMKKIGVVVLRAFLDPGEGNKVNYDIVEAFVGELDKNAVDPNTGATTFIDSVVNSQSEYIELYSNCFNQTATKKTYSQIDFLALNQPQKAGDLGFYKEDTVKNISLTDSILKALPMVWEKNEDINEKQIDIVCDAGVSNIAQFIKSCFAGRAGEYDPASEWASLFKLRNKEDTKTWRDVLAMYDNFCKNIRKDCMFVADGPRPFCLTGNKKIVRPSKPSNTVDANILPMLKYITGVNTNYGAGYCDWFEKSDEFSGDYFWCPPSIQAMGVYLNTDINHNFWSAPAGLNRGVVTALDVAFNPTMRQSNEIYPKCWNYARSYPNDGIVLEGQRTFQTKPTALDRINVRRTMLRLERMTYEISRYFTYEDNTMYTRQRLYDALDGVFKEIKGQGGIIDYKVICDESINTPEVIDRSEIRVKLGIKPVKSAEFILIEFNVLRQGGSWTEML